MEVPCSQDPLACAGHTVMMGSAPRTSGAFHTHTTHRFPGQVSQKSRQLQAGFLQPIWEAVMQGWYDSAVIATFVSQEFE